MSDELDIGANIQALKAGIREAEFAAGRAAGAARLIAVSKTQDPEAIRLALEAGHRRFGENRVQEALAKWPGLKDDFADAELHLIGPLQTNKVKHAVALFDVIQTIDRAKLARAVAAEIERSGRQVACLVQINVGEEAQKAGVAPAQADAFIAACRDEFGLSIAGLMCIPPLDEEPAPYFALLAKMAARNGLAEISMGMSADYETAVAFGATYVRVGTAIFGPRRERLE